MRRIRSLLLLCVDGFGLFSAWMCIQMIQKHPVTQPGVFVIGLIVFLSVLVVRMSRLRRSERYTMASFEKKWIIDRSAKKGLRYQDKPGCYVILIYRFPHLLPQTGGYSNVYVGQSLEVYQRIHNHLNRKGNGDVYADVRDGRHVEIEVYPCRKDQLNDLEIKLIRRYRAEEYYNRTAGGGTKRSFFG
ncbi:MAG: GIY-YIG nuclease family protein [Solobacterium sp.]|nr:GIY-YIG nuclease family protein [Solobacterium sp.]